MRTKIFGVLLFIGLGLLSSCSSDDDNSVSNETIDGVWHLKNVSGGLTGVDLDYTIDEVKWIFNEGNKTLLVENNIMTTGPKDIHAGLDSGTYTYSIEVNNDTKTLKINDNIQGILTITKGNLKIDDGVVADGFLKEFVR